MPCSVRFDAVEDAIADIKNGKIIIVVDDENRKMKEILSQPLNVSRLK